MFGKKRYKILVVTIKGGRDKLISRIFFATLLIICMVALSGCTANITGSGNSLSQDKYVAIEEFMKTNCTIINGSYNLPPHITLPAFFDYDGSDNGSNPAEGSNWNGFKCYISNNYYPAVNDSFKALYGNAYYRDVAPMDTRTGVRIKGIYHCPYVFDSGFVLRDIDRNGTINGSYKNSSIVLRSGEQWTAPVSTEIKSGSGTDMFHKPFSYTASFNTTWTITNLGILDKSNLTLYNNSNTDTGFSQLF